MKSPADMKIIQIDITNACTKKCSNCTRFCGNHRKPFMMDFDTFKRAVDSLQGFPGIVGIMGGEPTLHPQFEEFVSYFASKFGKRGILDNARAPITNFNAHIVGNVFDIDNSNQRGLWSVLGKRYYEHFELIQETFGYQVVNDHASPSDHAALLITRKELGIPDEEWIPMRDNCWIQNRWSASIHPKGAFFCEVAAALDQTFDGPGGWEIEPGWWKRKPEDFKEQLELCEMCSACLKVPTRNANDEIDDVSPLMYEKLVQIRSPKIKQNLINIVEVGCDGQPKQKVAGREVNTNTPYLQDEDHSLRVAPTNRTIYPKRFDAILLCNDGNSGLDRFLPLRQCFDDVVVLGSSLTAGERKLCDTASIPIVEIGDDLGASLNAALAVLKFSDWCFVIQPDFTFDASLLARLRNVVLNPGSLYSPVDNGVKPNSHKGARTTGYGLPPVIMFNALAHSLRGRLPDPFPSGIDMGEFLGYWPQNKQIVINANFDKANEVPRINAIDHVFEKIRADYSWIAQALPTPVGSRIMRLGAWAHATTRRAHSLFHRSHLR